MEFCEERDNPSKGGPALVPIRLCLPVQGIERDGQRAQICRDGNSAGSSPERNRNADGARIVQAQCSVRKINVRGVTQPSRDSEKTLAQEAAQHAERMMVQIDSSSRFVRRDL
jgi:hypothetical protein